MEKSTERNLKILVIDDDPVYRNLTRSILKKKAEVKVAAAPSEAFTILGREKFDITICDYKLPEMDGLEVLSRIKEIDPANEVIMISSAGVMNTVIDALRNGASDFLRKPFSSRELWLSIERTTRYLELKSDLKSAQLKNKHLREDSESELGKSIIGNSASIREVRDQITLVAGTPDTSVLILGESGTGKELVARGIHEASNRRDQLFGAINMSAVPEALFESEFFGHKKGSFTGAIADKAGWFESAHGGSLFLDEIGDMEASLQIKLLRVLEDRRYTMLGTHRERDFDIRILSATNKSMDELSHGKDFRLDLFHRLSTFIIEVPPLRERKQDIPLLSEHFLKILARRFGRKQPLIDPSVFQLLDTYTFPGNIRELKNLLERAMILCKDGVLKPENFGSILSDKTVPMDEDPGFDLKEMEKRTIEKALVKVNYNKAEAARILNLDWNALYRRMQKYGISSPGDA